ncbi:TetR family transcriptional regulator (plasmid) [Fulvitalea axinellae]|uniref:TetR family transcriptional regulator n=1 Tax=Fulvitalea axinellae TaxID=1182444 RepID=A0AAU9DCY5_9BACT|nr:TetR family transcriptional regulator [Fulvitalea axinellae]
MEKKKPRERILDVAMDLFHRQGYNSTGINQIIDEAKVAKASFYQHYKSKEDLAVAYLNKRHELWFEGLRKETNKAKNSEDKVLAAFRYLKLMNKREDFRGCVFLNMVSEVQTDNARIYEIIQNHKRDLREFLGELIPDKDNAFLAYMLYESCLTESQVYRNQEFIDKTLELLKENILGK